MDGPDDSETTNDTLGVNRTGSFPPTVFPRGHHLSTARRSGSTCPVGGKRVDHADPNHRSGRISHESTTGNNQSGSTEDVDDHSQSQSHSQSNSRSQSQSHSQCQSQWPAFLPSEGETMTTGTTEQTDFGCIPSASPGLLRGTSTGQQGKTTRVAGLRTPPVSTYAGLDGDDRDCRKEDERMGRGMGIRGASPVIVAGGEWEEIASPRVGQDDTELVTLGHARPRHGEATACEASPSTMSTPALTLQNLERLPGNANETRRKRFGLERTASWASASAGRVQASLNQHHAHGHVQGTTTTECSTCTTGDSGLLFREEAVRPGFKRSRTAHSGAPSLARCNGLNTRPVGLLQRSRSLSANTPGSASRTLANQEAPTTTMTTSATFHPYRLAPPSSVGKRLSSREMDWESPAFNTTKDAGYFDPSSAPKHRPSGLSRSNSDARSNGSSSTTSGMYHKRTGLLRPRLWRGHSQPVRSRPLFDTTGTMPGSSSSMKDVNAVDEYMVDMDRWIMGTGEAATKYPESSVPEKATSISTPRNDSVAIDDLDERTMDLDGQDGRLWVDGCRVKCGDGTECLATSEAYVLTVQLMHQAYSTSLYVSKEYDLHISGERTHSEEYQRVVEYPKTADMTKMKATLVDGLVSVHVPRLAFAPKLAASSCIRQRTL